MNDINTPEKAADSFMNSVGTAGQLGADSVRQVLDRSQTVANVVASLGVETASFVSRRVEQDSETLGSMVKCRSMPEMLELQVQWWRRAMDDYANQYANQVDRLVAFQASLMRYGAEASSGTEGKLPVAAASGAPQTRRQAA